MLCRHLVGELKYEQVNAMKELERRYKYSLHSFLKTKLKCSEDIQDMYQEGLIVLILKLKKGMEVNNFYSFLCRICQNLCKKNYRESAKNPTTASLVFDEFVHTDDQLDSKEISDTQEKINEIVRTLPLKDQKLIQLYYDHGMRLQEVANSLNKNITTVRKQHSRLLNKIKQVIIEM
jgi:RNA polymerase sigma factor (sigma-70 family)